MRRPSPPPLHPTAIAFQYEQTLARFSVFGIFLRSYTVRYKAYTGSERRMQGVTEKTILKMGVVRITNLRAIFGLKSYELSNITSASLQAQEPNLFVPVFFAVVLGLCSFMVAISNFEELGYWLQIGLFTAIAAIIMFLISRRTKYSVQISNPVSKLVVLETYDGNYAESVVRAVNDAIAKGDYETWETKA
ncbi:MAG TPA: DUF6232 family protein [Anaerolineales bacterium]|jgi:uncharacterized protein DUF6232|nr:DUF6232 family protein [Anaerolineales bacterium]